MLRELKRRSVIHFHQAQLFIMRMGQHVMMRH